MISSELQELYQEVILDHNKKPRNFRPMETPNKADGYNPLCGDKVTVYLQLENGTIQDVTFQGTGCAISTASASVMTTVLKGKTREEVEALFGRFHHLVTRDPEEDANLEDLGKLAVFSGVREFPVRVKCATLAWHTLKAAIEGTEQTVSTE